MIRPVNRADDLTRVISEPKCNWSHEIAKQKKSRLGYLVRARDRRVCIISITDDVCKGFKAQKEINDIDRASEDLKNAYSNLVAKYKKFKKNNS